MKTTFTCMLSLLLLLTIGCSQEELPKNTEKAQQSKELLQKQIPNLTAIANSDSSRQATNSVIRSLANTTWDFIIYNGDLSWHADVVFHPNGTTTYDEPDYPGQYIHYGTWRQNANVIYYDLDAEETSEAFYFTGTINGNAMTGTYTFGTGPQDWTAQKY